MIKKLITIIALTFSIGAWAESYACNFMSENLTRTFTRIVHSEDFIQFRAQTVDTDNLYSIARENKNFLHLFRDHPDGGVSHYTIGKTDNSFVGVWLEHEDSSGIFNGRCFIVRE